jgi:hypothetical protein
MVVTKLTLILATAATMAWLPSSCSKSQNSKAAIAKSAAKAPAGNSAGNVSASADTEISDGLSMTNNTEAVIQLGAGKSCRIKPVLLDEKNLQLTLALELKNADGVMQSLIIKQVVTQPGKPFNIVLEGTDIALTPIIVQ